MTRLFAIWFAVALVGLSCQGATTREDPTGGETHFLTVCRDSSDCGDALSCLYGVCTRSCDGNAACRPFPRAECTATSLPDLPGYCDVRCITDPDCAVLSNEHRCAQGACRLGTPLPTPTGGSGGGGGSGGATGGAAGAGGSSDCPSGDVAPNQVLIIGDSFFGASHQITAYLEELARTSGALSSGERYRDNSGLLANSLSGGGIEEQYARAAEEAEVKVVIMNGGGADALIAQCDQPSLDCPPLGDAVSAAEQLFARMADDGVANVVYAYYPDAVDTTTRAKVDALRPALQSACENSRVPCFWLDLRPTFAGRYGEFVQPDGMNPTAPGALATAEAIWNLLGENCVAQ